METCKRIHLQVAYAFTGRVMSQGVRIRDFESNRRKFERIVWTFVQAALAFCLALLFITVVPAVGFVSFIKLVAELMSH